MSLGELLQKLERRKGNVPCSLASSPLAGVTALGGACREPRRVMETLDKHTDEQRLKYLSSYSIGSGIYGRRFLCASLLPFDVITMLN